MTHIATCETFVPISLAELLLLMLGLIVPWGRSWKAQRLIDGTSALFFSALNPKIDGRTPVFFLPAD
jgi:hypothetical protein